MLLDGRHGALVHDQEARLLKDGRALLDVFPRDEAAAARALGRLELDLVMEV